ncbi:glycosyltransferase [Chthonobacter albigriseus]|uniref:glycosyltransferase n=1 Tax=Chthonobacter albigriseus TaxID=1683161 RepID=UPI0024583747|nr:glycosyltransferase [Chthonobacter albigriseus]
MHVVLVAPNLRVGGAERSMLRYAACLQRAGHSVSLVLLENRIELPVPADIAVHSLATRGPRGTTGKIVAGIRLARKLKALSSVEPIDLTISTLPLADEVALRASAPNLWLRVANTLSAEIASIGSSKHKRERRLKRYIRMYGENRCIAVSESVRRDLIDFFGLAPNKAVTIYNPIPIEEIQALSKMMDSRIPEQPFVLHAARFAPQKRIDVLLDAMRRVDPEVRVVLLTDNPAAVTRIVLEYAQQDRSLVLPLQDNPFVWFRRAKAVVLSSDREGMPNVLAEALAVGTPVVSTDCPSGPRELLTGDLARWLSPCGDAAALARNVTAVLASPPVIPTGVLDRFSEKSFIASMITLAMQRDAR